MAEGPACLLFLAGRSSRSPLVRECCRYRTARVQKTTLQAATCDSSGRQRIRKECSYCRHVDEEIVVLPRLTPPEERSSSGSGSSPGVSSSWSGGGSGGSSSGSRSSGGGAGGRW